MRERVTFRSGNAVLAGERSGAGTPLAFLHAGVCDRRMFGAQIDALADRYLTVAYDRRGFGETMTPDETFSHADDFAIVMAALETGPALLVGCSQGGRVAIDFALQHPEKVIALVLVSPALSGADDPAEMPGTIAELTAALESAEEAGDIDRVNAIEAHLWLDGPLAPEGRVSGAVRRLFLEMNEIALRAPEWRHRVEPPSVVDRLGTIDMPALLVCGDLDSPYLQERHVWLAERLPMAQAEIMAGTAHLPSLERPDAFNGLLDRFLTAHVASA